MNRTKEMAGDIEIDVKKHLLACLHRWWLIVLCAAVACAAMLIYTYSAVTPVYRAGVSLYVNNIRADERIDYRSESNLSAASRLVRSYMNIVKSNRVLKVAAKELGGKYTVKQLRHLVSTAQVGELEIFYIYATHPDAQEAARIANTLGEVAPGIISALVEGTSAYVIDVAEIPEALYGPNYVKRGAVAALAGAFVAVCIIVLLTLLDVGIKNEQEFLTVADLPILGRIPDFDQLNKENAGGYYRYASRAYGRSGKGDDKNGKA